VQDTATGKDVYKALAVRLSLYIAVALYAWAAIYVLETLRAWRKNGALTRTLGARDKQQK
jgi:hypothetical protein